MEFIKYLLNLIFVVPIVLLLFFITIRLGKTGFNKISGYNYSTILEKTNLSKDTYLMVLKMGDKGCVGVLSPSKFEIIKELDSDEIKELEVKKNQFLGEESKVNFNFNFDLDEIKIKIKNLSLKKEKVKE